MCWIQITFNVKKHKSLIPTDLFESIVSDIHDLHYSYNNYDFQQVATSYGFCTIQLTSWTFIYDSHLLPSNYHQLPLTQICLLQLPPTTVDRFYAFN